MFPPPALLHLVYLAGFSLCPFLIPLAELLSSISRRKIQRNDSLNYLDITEMKNKVVGTSFNLSLSRVCVCLSLLTFYLPKSSLPWCAFAKTYSCAYGYEPTPWTGAKTAQKSAVGTTGTRLWHTKIFAKKERSL